MYVVTLARAQVTKMQSEQVARERYNDFLFGSYKNVDVNVANQRYHALGKPTIY